MTCVQIVNPKWKLVDTMDFVTCMLDKGFKFGIPSSSPLDFSHKGRDKKNCLNVNFIKNIGFV